MPSGFGLQLGRSVFAAWSHDEIVLLDLATDKYYGLDSEASRILENALRGTLPSSSHSGRATETLSWLRSRGLVEPFEAVDGLEPRTVISIATEPGGLSTIDLPRNKLRGTVCSGFTLLVQALLTLARVDLLASRQSVGRVVQAIDLAQRTPSDHRMSSTQQDEMVSRIMDAVGRAILLYPRRLDCLVRAGALTLVLVKNGIDAVFVIGVQKYPFFAHAWVEYRESVLGDSEEVRRRLAPLIRIARNRREQCLP